MTPIPLDPHNPAKAKKLKQLALIGGVGVLAIIFLISRRSSSSSTTGSSTANSGIDPATGIPYSQEASSGGYSDPYGSPSTFADNGSSAAGLADAVTQGLGNVQTALQNLQASGTGTGTPTGSIDPTAAPAGAAGLNVTIRNILPHPGGHHAKHHAKHPAKAPTHTKPAEHRPPGHTVVKSHGPASHPNHAQKHHKHRKR